MKSRVRISGGRLRGRSLRVADGIRPSGGRLREALFDVWQDRIYGARVLDLFAGSGAVGLEALSRGAAEAVFVEHDRQAVRHLQANCHLARPASTRVIKLELPSGFRRLAEYESRRFECIFADPPYRFTQFSELLAGLAQHLATDGEAAIEHRVGLDLPQRVGELQRVDCRRYGDSGLTFYRHRSAAPLR